MPSGHYKRKEKKTTNVPYRTLKIQSPLFKVNIRFLHKNSNPKVWQFIESQIKKEFKGFQEVADAIMGMNQEELDMLEY